ncbi:MAG: hypothetical protein CO137_01825 [Candidatus Magasanikbacteria bacterium CG_4_9_14_3_um_filter_32_9]|uniref:Uncharacterized protein n=1 Tax=Candidatus Magasanikbacteria bacterium CG_4_9_14_3_um_filter_32_9 TaxID=1974644 RepID=A0A2M7Z6V5_9BACT|nr:MAG: hypothetical protein CO137_01825 [Candidatus Magasanikbacteria bacterium CG_4_9_14_3_um_filter_32_9]
MFSQKTLTTLLVLAIVALSYQTFMLANMSKKIDEAGINTGNSTATINFTDDGSAPSMVGGC